MGDIDGPALRRWLKAGKDRAAQLRGLRMESLQDDRSGEIVDGDIAALVLTDDAQKILRVPVAALDHWILADVPTDVRTLIEAVGHGMDEDRIQALRQSGFAPDHLSHAQCATLLRLLQKPQAAWPSDVLALERLLQDSKNCNAAYDLLDAIRQKGNSVASDAARSARARLPGINPVFADEVARRKREKLHERVSQAIHFAAGSSYGERLAIAESIFSRAKSCQDLMRLKDAMRFGFWHWMFADDPEIAAEIDQYSASMGVLRARIDAQMRELQCE